jgi:hypothetical protein
MPNIGNSTKRDEDTWSDATRERTSLAFRSILFDGAALVTKGEEGTEPAYFCDLNLDQVLDSIASGREETSRRSSASMSTPDSPDVWFNPGRAPSSRPRSQSRACHLPKSLFLRLLDRVLDGVGSDSSDRANVDLTAAQNH